MFTTGETDIWMNRIILLLAIYFMGCFLAVAAASLFYPYPLEWMEGQVINSVQRIVDGQPFYTRPTLEYVPLIYTPLYFYVTAALASWGGADYWMGRIISLLSIIGTGWILGHWAAGSTGDRSVKIVTAGLFAATYAASGRWFDLARCDSLFLFLLLAGLYLLMERKTSRSAVVSGCLLAAAFFTKQSTLMVAAPVLLACLWHDRRRALYAAATLVAGLAAGLWWLRVISDGWVNFYIFQLPATHGLRDDYIALWLLGIMGPTTLLVGVALYALLYGWKTPHRPDVWRMAALLAGSIGCSYLSLLHIGGYRNVLMPAHAALALAAGWLWREQRMRKAPERALVTVVLILQFMGLAYAPSPLIPDKGLAARHEAFLAEIAAIEGEVFMPEYQFLSGQLNKKSFDFGMAGYDLVRAGMGTDNTVAQELRQELYAAIESQRFAAIVSGCLLLPEDMGVSYILARALTLPAYVTGGEVPCDSLFFPVPKGPS